MINFAVVPTSDEIVEDVEGEKEDLNEERLVGPSDEGDDDPSDTTPAEAEELADEGGEIIKKLREEE
ncbi:MAG: hypothetical protein A3B91_01740 [Candidatus Yanofskybacteria bacterium RIFCSPHIGHO2_02_FULL_41_29]|uniref:Uncharacterized protein n=1 Tax=Candidatus Yanofskybacteria bacterium RIFCSPHIGHO2_01_FULL_41_53 TaxID=1802663 RepID=A0A1F8EKL3_9BACT|nr:MAG: hypothetical protein A2650_03170 [Candidatus Yanofskybacteria bacterium RIFCSPHIGHO2_01_FULL_41_53]OGN11846.1 MAG: hypothetical protein A3B91_01740 [Candidatus Yanofskybacteria bacterium RIFCSPHIGHO2_02_FULL_41_29]OGN17249.1 MAG: hypothetical protein A3F48_03525 [Candidatus Yanofskybacteria bacterium RIFCSPHIGHO2_12_FULL_41_9]OGN23094.1 MAG: hypothetical protein A2916_05090 [Candidatus Yanofskybacteria bacterium RIFCSPLOWO2_01_FULL_41_67]OGN29897.1 MAG: hypothetical protein A3H54_03845 